MPPQRFARSAAGSRDTGPDVLERLEFSCGYLVHELILICRSDSPRTSHLPPAAEIPVLPLLGSLLRSWRILSGLTDDFVDLCSQCRYELRRFWRKFHFLLQKLADFPPHREGRVCGQICYDLI